MALPFDVWCSNCNDLLPHGRRFNAQKKVVDHYLGIPIYSFRIKCNACFSYLDIRTDPQNSDYIVYEGGKRKTEHSESDSTQEGLPYTLHSLRSDKSLKESKDNPFAKLEQEADEKEKLAERKITYETTLQASERRYGTNSVQNNRLLRSIHRVERKKAEALEREAESRGLAIALLPNSDADEAEAKQIMNNLDSKKLTSPKAVKQSLSKAKNGSKSSIFQVPPSSFKASLRKSYQYSSSPLSILTASSSMMPIKIKQEPLDDK